mmetsp:Transcript_24598/g.62456  ORF Transcript_24598/g.62456 Transcript_24598/m.62456 type:complete len:298 (+) Transcript_24598:249-1142(+)
MVQRGVSPPGGGGPPPWRPWRRGRALARPRQGVAASALGDTCDGDVRVGGAVIEVPRAAHMRHALHERDCAHLAAPLVRLPWREEGCLRALEQAGRRVRSEHRAPRTVGAVVRVFTVVQQLDPAAPPARIGHEQCWRARLAQRRVEACGAWRQHSERGGEARRRSVIRRAAVALAHGRRGVEQGRPPDQVGRGGEVHVVLAPIHPEPPLHPLGDHAAVSRGAGDDGTRLGPRILVCAPGKRRPMAGPREQVWRGRDAEPRDHLVPGRVRHEETSAIGRIPLHHARVLDAAIPLESPA